jgi:hypothetical protein
LSPNNKVINEVPLYNKVSVVFDTNGFHCTGKFSYIRYNVSESAKTYLTNHLLSRGLLFDKDVEDNKLIIPKNIRSIDIGSNEDSWKTIDNKLAKISNEIPELKNQGLDVPGSAATIVFNNPNNMSNKTQKMYSDLKKKLGLEKTASSSVFLTELRNSKKFSNAFKDLFKTAVEVNDVFLNVSVTSEDLKNKAVSMFSNKNVLEKLSDVEVQFLLKHCFNCEDLQIKTAEDLMY